ncbi:sodium/bile acid cotransporter 7-B-like isoform X2 [Lycorma delicatula]|uniref:sodium/bile acid cotransporter 7-B-like isoform X2 n=1 Tax=Lycorma delicatula TaxID=130591 RepID=UPI003F51863D
MLGVASIVKKHWFLIGILGSIFFAEVYPSLGSMGGTLKPEWSVNYIAITIIFFFYGLLLSTSDILLALRRIKVHLFIQIFTFILFPIFVLFINSMLKITFSVNDWILKGLAIVSCMPPPISSAIIITRAVGGNEAVAVCNTIIGSFIGLFVTPLALFFILGTTAVVSVTTALITLCETVLLPLGVGQLARGAGFLSFQNVVLKVLPCVKFNLTTFGQLTLLFILYSTFCDVFLTHDIPMIASDILITVILGIPVLKILFSGYAHFSQITLPLFLYHPTQTILGGLLVPYLKKWLITNKNEEKLLP